MTEALRLLWEAIALANTPEALEHRAAKRAGRAQYWRRRAATFRQEACQHPDGSKRHERLLQKARVRERWAKENDDRASALEVRAKLTKELRDG